jgi:hypothetical protein
MEELLESIRKQFNLENKKKLKPKLEYTINTTPKLGYTINTTPKL